MQQSEAERREVERLLKAIQDKLESQRLVLGRSLDQGGLTWRKTRAGQFEITLKPNI